MQTSRFRYLPHTADIAFVAYGKDLKTALENSAEALLNIMLDLRKVRKVKIKPSGIVIRESAGNRENLVWYALQSILTKVDERKLSAYSFRVKKLTEGKKPAVSGILLYKKTNKDLSLTEVKAVTPHDLEVKKRKNGYAIHVLVDV